MSKCIPLMVQLLARKREILDDGLVLFIVGRVEHYESLRETLSFAMLHRSELMVFS